MKNYFNLKDKIKPELRPLLVYTFKCNSCKIKRHYRKRTSEHIGVFPFTGKCVKNNSHTSGVNDYLLLCKIVVCPEDFSIIGKSSCNFKLGIPEGILSKLLKWNFKKHIFSVPL